MKHSLNFLFKSLLQAIFFSTTCLWFSVNSVAAPASAPLSLATSPLATSTTTAVKPNLLLVIDNSGSMNWEHMPDEDADGGSAVLFQYGYFGSRSSQCNQVYYDPTVTYLPPVDATGIPFANASFTAAWVNGFSTGSGTVNLSTGFKASQNPNNNNSDSYAQSAYYYKYSGTQNTQLLKNYNSTTNAFFKECSSDLNSPYINSIAPVNGVKAITGGTPSPSGTGVFNKFRLATTETATIVVSGSSSSAVGVTSIKVNNVDLMNAYTSATNPTTNIVASGIAASINKNGFTASVSGSTITITGPASAANFTPVIAVASGTMIFTPDIFPDTTAVNLTNFANWYSFYRSRIQMMKTATGRAFSNLNSNYRVGLMNISSSTPLMPIDVFTGSQRTNWYSALYNISVNGSTPLRAALSNAGMYYAGTLAGTTDPLQYSCQQNFTIISTDGYWNTGTGYKMDGSTPVGNQDGSAGSPMWDGAQAASTVTTPYTRNSYTKVSGSCSGSQKQLQIQPQSASCSVTAGVETCTSWSNTGTISYGACGASSSITYPNPNPSARMPSGPPVTTAGSTGGTSDTLADVAMYYYQTDLRPGTCTLCTDNVFTTTTDDNVKQHMTTFTLGLGASGIMNYSPTYLTDTTGDYLAVAQRSQASPTVCSWQYSSTTPSICTWPKPGLTSTNTSCDNASGASDGCLANVDDLWHAAVNGHGAYFSATNPTSLSTGLSNALAAINARRGSAAAAATSTLNPVAGNNLAYVASYGTVAWKGNLEARGINTVTGAVNENAIWCAENVVQGTCASPGYIVTEAVGDTNIAYCDTPTSTICTGGILVGSDCKVPVATSCTGTMNAKVSSNSDTRQIWTKGANAASLNNFNITGGDLSVTDFNATRLANLSQWTALTSTQQTAAVGNAIVSYLRGQTQYDDRTTNDNGIVNNRLFRYREATLGDAIESQPAYIGKPTFSYTDSGYSAFVNANAARSGTVYMGANDGMMHAFDANSGNEGWAYVPSMLIPKMYALADKNYANNHAYYANGSPIISDIYDGSNWRTILVAGLNGGGRGYYALDVTNPALPKLLWEFTPANDGNLGYTFGNPVITKKADGTWVVLVTSGYNNIPESGKLPVVSSGNGQGYLYVLNAMTGAIVGSPIGTGVGSASVPSGLAQITSWADNPEKNNTATYTYGGDLLGNVWRFDINAGTKMLFAVLKDSSGIAQPITTRPELGSVLTSDGLTHRVVFIGTGKYLETNDLTDTQQQTLYAIKDDNATATIINPRITSGSDLLVQQTLTTTGVNRTASNNAVDFKSVRGWYVNFPDIGERQNVSSQLVLGTLLVPTTVPSNTVCAPGGSGWLNYFNYTTGGAVDTSTNNVSTKMTAPVVGVNVLYIEDSSGKTKPVVSVVTADNPTPALVPTVQFSSSGSGFQGKRVIWRELIQ